MRADLRVFSSFVDHKQEILWLGTDGNGIVKLTKENSLVTNLIFDKLSSSINGQVRGIMTDKMGTLWVGTKGDGLIRIPSYEGREDAEGIVVYNPNTRCALRTIRAGPVSFRLYAEKTAVRRGFLGRHARFNAVLLFLSARPVIAGS